MAFLVCSGFSVKGAVR
nr:hypothetical protein [Vibrio parahaemolyticus]